VRERSDRSSRHRIRDRLRRLELTVGSKLALIIVGFVMLGLAVYGTLSEGFGNFAINLGVEGLVTLMALAIIGPLVRMTQEGTFRFHGSLNYRRFIEQAEQARRQVQILTTFTPLLQSRNHYSDRFLSILGKLVARQVQVDVLLLHPDSLSVPQRQREVARVGGNVTDGIHDNIRILSSFIAGLAVTDAQYVSVRIYDASASIIMHRWDDRSLISFLPTDRLAEEGSHLEIDMRSSIGSFVGSRYGELWHDPTTVSLAEYMMMPLTLIGNGESRGSISVRYVTIDGARYVDSTEIIAAQARNREHALRVSAGGVVYDVDVVDSDDLTVYAHLMDVFRRKFGRDVRTLVRLIPCA
jgi:hypothetical protein